MRDDSVLSAAQRRSVQSPPFAEVRATDGVDAAKDPVQAAHCDRMLDRAVPQPKAAHLLEGDHPMLPGGKA